MGIHRRNASSNWCSSPVSVSRTHLASCRDQETRGSLAKSETAVGKPAASMAAGAALSVGDVWDIFRCTESMCGRKCVDVAA